jgi:TonB-dependent SusC/RagA subfamily outer membrane receptor
MGSSRITLRGESSLNLDNNQALIVVDGVPISSKITGTGYNAHLAADNPVDFGSTVSDINPDDIEKITVLKGAGATALYGSRAAGGAIIITTKSGQRKGKGIGVTYLYTMERAVEPLRNDSRFIEWMTMLESPVRGAGVGAIVTVIIQSSSATVGMVITLAKKGLLTLSAGIAVMLGAELGTCADTLLATVRADRQSVKTGLFHLFFNIVSIGVGLLIFPWFVQFIESISGNASLQQKVANAHMAFNITGVLLFIPLIGFVERLLDRLLPQKATQPAAGTE